MLLWNSSLQKQCTHSAHAGIAWKAVPIYLQLLALILCRYQWVDNVPLSRPKRNIARDCSDGCLVAEIVHHFEPKLVELHNYVPGNSSSTKFHNWNTLNSKVFRKHLRMRLQNDDIERVVHCEPGAIERVLKLLRLRLSQYRQAKDKQKEQKRQAAAAAAAADASSSAHAGPPASPSSSVASGSTVGEMRTAKRADHTLTSFPHRAEFASGESTALANEDGQCTYEQHGAKADESVAAKSSDTTKTGLQNDGAESRREQQRDREQQQQEQQSKHLQQSEREQLMQANEILQAKVSKLERLVKLKDQKIQQLTSRLEQAGVNVMQ